MRLIGDDLVREFTTRHPESKKVFAKWSDAVRAASWKHPMEVKQTFNHADFLGEGRIIFDIGGNKYRLVAIAVYTAGFLDIRWVGTHAEYDKIKL